MKILFITVIFIFLSACANTNKLVKNPTNKDEVSSKVYVKKSEFGEHRIYAPEIVKDFRGILNTDKVTVQLMKAENNRYYVRIHNVHTGNGWKFIESITTMKKETIKLQDLSREHGFCSGAAGCAFQEIGFAPINPRKYLSAGHGPHLLAKETHSTP